MARVSANPQMDVFTSVKLSKTV